MSWRDTYREKLASAEAAVAPIGPGARVYLGGNAATPRVLADALARHAPDAPGISVGHVLLLGADPFADLRAQGLVRHAAWFVGPADRAAVREGRADYIPCHLSEIPRILRDDPRKLDATLVMVSPPDRHGYFSLGVEVLASQAAIRASKRVIVQVNPHMPRVYGTSFVHVDDVHAIVDGEEPLVELLPQPPTDVERAIAGHIAKLIPEHATLQLGIGGIPNAVIGALEGRTDLGVHTEMVSDGVMAAVERGIVTGKRKPRNPGKVITTFVLGSRRLYDWVHENPGVEAHPCDYTNDLIVASSHDNLVAINSAISVDLTGQVNADSIGSSIYSGVGGQVDFMRAASRSKGGVPIIAMSSTAARGTVSRIVVSLAEGAGVVTSRADAHVIVTEYGFARLYGRSLRRRAEELVQIAHPDFRDALGDEVRRRWPG